MKIGLATYHKLADLNEDDKLLFQALKQQSSNNNLIESVSIVDWEDEIIDWSIFDIIIIRSIWNYHLKYKKFIDWLELLDSINVKVWNNSKIIQWNSNKLYLKEISTRFPSIESYYITQEQYDDDLLGFYKFSQKNQWNNIVIKPVISASAYNTIKTSLTELKQKRVDLQPLIQHSDLIIQPFVEEIKTQGEWSVIYFNGKFSHSVLKLPKSGDYRTQPELGGTRDPKKCSESIINTGSQLLDYISKKFSTNILYARVDGIDLEGKFTIMEIELIEPFLYLASEKQAVHNLVEAILKLLVN